MKRWTFAPSATEHPEKKNHDGCHSTKKKEKISKRHDNLINLKITSQQAYRNPREPTRESSENLENHMDNS